MKYYLQFSNGCRIETMCGGGMFALSTKRVGDRVFETRFEALPEVVDDCIVYAERETKDVTDEYAASAKRIAEWQEQARQRHDAALRTRAARLLQRLAAMIEGV